MEMSFKNGSKVCVPEDITAIYSSAPTDGPRHAEGALCGDHRIMAGLIVGMIDKFYNNLTDERKVMFAMAVISIFQNNPAENMTIESMTIMKKKPEEADDE